MIIIIIIIIVIFYDADPYDIRQADADVEENSGVAVWPHPETIEFSTGWGPLVIGWFITPSKHT